MLLPSEAAIAEAVFKRIGGRWYWVLVGAACLVLFVVCTLSGPNQAVQNLRNRDNAMALLGYAATLLVVIISATEIPHDVSSRVLLVILSKPLRRYQFVLGKFLGIVVIGGVFVLVGGLFSLAVLWYQGLPGPELLVVPRMLGLALLRMVVVAGMALLFSTSLSEIPSIAFTAGYMILAYAVSLVAPLVYRGEEMAPAARWTLGSLLWLAPNLRDFVPITWTAAAAPSGDLRFTLDSFTRAATPDWGQLGASALYATAYVCVFVALAVLAFRRRIIV
jgi:ABC-type transport system involved in multi-copper enzyme maturation permease subunit